MKKSLIILFSCLLSASMMMAQHQRGKFNPEEFKAKLESFITGEAGFSEAEAQAFYPIYHEMKGKQRQLQREIFGLKKEMKNDEVSEKDYAATIQKIKELGVEMAEIEAEYYKKLCGTVSPKKVYRAMQAEDRFHRKMLEDFGHARNHRREHETK